MTSEWHEEASPRVYLTPDEIRELYGFEPIKSAEIVEVYTRRLLNGARFPPVEVVPYQGGFRIAYKHLPGSRKLDGGHYRSLASIRARKHLPIIVTQDDALEQVRPHLVQLCDVRLVTAEDDTFGLFKKDREERLGTLDEQL